MKKLNQIYKVNFWLIVLACTWISSCNNGVYDGIKDEYVERDCELQNYGSVRFENLTNNDIVIYFNGEHVVRKRHFKTLERTPSYRTHEY